MRKTKIVCTLGLVSQTEEIIGQLMDAGMNVARFNFSHGTHESHKKMFDIVHKLRDEKKIPMATLLDTKGPEVRLGMFDGDRTTLVSGENFTLTNKDVLGTNEIAHVSYSNLSSDVSVGATLLIDDGLIELKVISIENGDITCKVINGGPVSNRKGINVPGVALSMPYISAQDKADIVFGATIGFEFIAASFVRTAGDVLEIRQILHDCRKDDIRIIAKIESAQGVLNIDEILRVSDGIMVARGDMGVEIDFSELPYLQKVLIQKAYNAGKIVITATQMLDSMMKNPRPTRAETTDVANAIYDGTSAIMLSGETAAGAYPVKTVETMVLIADRTERDINYKKRFMSNQYDEENDNVTNAISHATCTTAYHLSATAIITVTLSGHTARRISKYRPDIPIIGCTVSQTTYHQLAISWGVVPVIMQEEQDLDILFAKAVDAACAGGYIKSGDVVVISTGVPLGMSGTTNLLKVHIAGDILVSGTGVNSLCVCASLCVCHSEADALQSFTSGNILVIKETTNALLPLLKQAAGVITELAGTGSHAAIACLALDIPVIVGAENATNILKSGTVVTMDADRGVVSNASN